MFKSLHYSPLRNFPVVAAVLVIVSALLPIATTKAESQGKNSPKVELFVAPTALHRSKHTLLNSPSVSEAAKERMWFIAPSAWKVLGPFPNPQGSGFQRAFHPEFCGIRLETRYRGDKGEWIRWRSASRSRFKEYLDFSHLYPTTEERLAYAFTTVYSPKKREVQFRVKSDDALGLMGGLLLGYFLKQDDYSLRKPVAYHAWWNFLLGTMDFVFHPRDSLISGAMQIRF